GGADRSRLDPARGDARGDGESQEGERRSPRHGARVSEVLLGGGRTLRYDERVKVSVVIALVLLVATPVAAQPVEIEKPAPPAEQRERERAVITPGLSGEGRPLEADNYPRGGRVPYGPGFVRGLSAERETPASTGRVGVAGWTAPNTPVG